MDPVRELLIERTQKHGAKSDLAAACGVAPATVTKWLKGLHPVDAGYWTRIEEHLGLDEGTLSRMSGVTPPVPVDDVGRLQRQIDELHRRLDDVTELLAALAHEPAPPEPPRDAPAARDSRPSKRSQESRGPQP